MSSGNLARFALMVALFVALSTSAAGAQPAVASRTAVPSLTGGVIAAEFTSGVLGGMVGFVGGGLATQRIARWRGSDDDHVSRAAYVGALSGAALMTAAGPALFGSRGGVHGSYPVAVGGAVAGGVVSALIRRIGKSGVLGDRGPVAIVAAAAILALPSVGATIAYNGSRRR